MKRFEIKVTAKMDYLTAGDTSNPLTSVTTELIAETETEFKEKFENFLSKIAPFHSLPTGCSSEEAAEIVERRNSIIKNLQEFSGKCYNLWTAIQVNSKFNHWEIDVRLMAEY